MARNEATEFLFPREAGERGRLEYVGHLTDFMDNVKAAVRANLSWDEYKEWCAHQAEKDQEEACKQDLLLVRQKHDPTESKK